MGHAMRKRFFGHMRTAKAQISLHIHAVWSGSLLSANRIIGHYIILIENIHNIMFYRFKIDNKINLKYAKNS